LTRIQQGGQVKTALKNLELARNEKGPMSSRNKSYSIDKKGEVTELKKAIQTAIFNNTNEYLNPPIKNISYKGIEKTATEIKKWFKNSKDIKGDFQTTSMLMERAGTGGSIFRNLYRDFLKESYDLLKIEGINDAYKDFKEIAQHWKSVSDLFYKVGETSNIKYINEASEILLMLSEKERIAMEKLKLEKQYSSVNGLKKTIFLSFGFLSTAMTMILQVFLIISYRDYKSIMRTLDRQHYL
jgi:hypothetical protein